MKMENVIYISMLIILCINNVIWCIKCVNLTKLESKKKEEQIYKPIKHNTY